MSAFRIVGGVATILAVVTGALPDAPAAPALHASTAVAPLPLSIRLTAADDLPPASRIALMAETGEIWKRARIRVTWLHGNAEARGATLRVLVIPRTVGSATDTDPWAVAELL